MPRSKSYRIHHRNKRIRKAMSVLSSSWGISEDTYSKEFISKMAKKHADNLKKCSCDQCRNKRVSEGPTLQERRSAYNIMDK